MSTASDLDRSNDIEAIRDVARRYVRAVDTRDVALLRTCYHPGAHENHNEYDGDVEGYCAHLLESAATTESTRQEIKDIAVTLDGDRAESRTACIAVYRTLPTVERPRAKQITVELEYVDELECRDGRWATVRRVCVPGAIVSVENIASTS